MPDPVTCNAWQWPHNCAASARPCSTGVRSSACATPARIRIAPKAKGAGRAVPRRARSIVGILQRQDIGDDRPRFVGSQNDVRHAPMRAVQRRPQSRGRHAGRIGDPLETWRVRIGRNILSRLHRVTFGAHALRQDAARIDCRWRPRAQGGRGRCDHYQCRCRCGSNSRRRGHVCHFRTIDLGFQLNARPAAYFELCHAARMFRAAARPGRNRRLARLSVRVDPSALDPDGAAPARNGSPRKTFIEATSASESTNSLLKYSNSEQRCAAFEFKIWFRRIFRAPGIPVLNQCCAEGPFKNLFQQTAKAS